MKRSPATVPARFWYKFNPECEELMEIQKSYSELMDQANRHSNEQMHHDAKFDRLGCYADAQANSAMQRQAEALQMEKSLIEKKATFLKAKIELLVTEVFEMHAEMEKELTYDDAELNVEQYRDFLKKYKAALETNSNLPCYNSNACNEVIAAINTYLPETIKK